MEGRHMTIPRWKVNAIKEIRIRCCNILRCGKWKTGWDINVQLYFNEPSTRRALANPAHGCYIRANAHGVRINKVQKVSSMQPCFLH